MSALKKQLSLVVIAALAACGGSDGSPGAPGTNGTNGTSTLVRTTAEPAGTHCAGGGQLLEYGLDANGDSNLDDDEVSGQSYLCNGDEGQAGDVGNDGDDGLGSLLNTTAEPAGDNCPAGGFLVEVGVDDDANGVLDAAEVDSSEYLCHGEDGVQGDAGLTSLVSISTEPAGDNCADGGQAISVGLDDNANGVLDPEEIDQVTYACNGADGTNGTDGLTSLINLTAEPEGTNCRHGGQKIEVGLDDNANGVLDTAEIDETSYVCDGVSSAAVTLTATPDVQTVFNDPAECYVYTNNLMSSIWDGVSNRLLVSAYSEDGYWSHPARVEGWAAAPDNDTSKRYGRLVFTPVNRRVVRGGTNQQPSPAATFEVGTLTTAGMIIDLQAAVFSDGFTGDCFLISNSATEFLCFDGTVVRHYETSTTTGTLQWVKNVTLETPPSYAHAFGGTFAWDGMFYYLPASASSSSSRGYAVHDVDGALVGSHTANGSGAINSTYFNWSVGRYSTHDGYGNRRGVVDYVGVSGGSDSDCFSNVSIYHQ